MFFAIRLAAQPNLEQYDLKRLHFGFTLAANNGSVRIDTKTTSFNGTDSLMNVKSTSFPGIGLGAITNLRLGDYWDLRLMFPVISFVERDLTYQFTNVQKIIKIESAYCDGSLLLKYKSARRKNTRLYVIAGLRGSYDLSSTTKQNRSMAAPVVSLIPMTFGYEGGFGLDLYFEYFKFSPEVKICNTFGDAMYHDGYIYTESVARMAPQLVQFSLHFE
ncbi:MAG: outer membrane beta-barrel protein [Bacteroidota bacterium]